MNDFIRVKINFITETNISKNEELQNLPEMPIEK